MLSSHKKIPSCRLYSYDQRAGGKPSAESRIIFIVVERALEYNTFKRLAIKWECSLEYFVTLEGKIEVLICKHMFGDQITDAFPLHTSTFLGVGKNQFSSTIVFLFKHFYVIHVGKMPDAAQALQSKLFASAFSMTLI